MPPVTIDRYNHAILEQRFAGEIAARFHLEGAAVQIRSSTLADLDQDGESDDLFGTALLQVGSRFKSFIYLLRDDGSARFLEDTGNALDAGAGLIRPMCTESRAWLCRYDFARARRTIREPRISLREFDASNTGLELVIHRPSGNLTVLNSLALFVSP